MTWETKTSTHFKYLRTVGTLRLVRLVSCLQLVVFIFKEKLLMGCNDCITANNIDEETTPTKNV